MGLLSLSGWERDSNRICTVSLQRESLGILRESVYLFEKSEKSESVPTEKHPRSTIRNFIESFWN
jgi:hypothetical protein